MMKIAIFGKNSFIGLSVGSYLIDEYELQVVYIDSRNNDWRSLSFSEYEAIICVAGIAHVSSNPSKQDLYYSINRDLPIAVAKKAKNDGVKQFIFLSSMIVYGEDVPLPGKSIITASTIPIPTNCYSKSKLEAEQDLFLLQDSNFKIACIRLPMVYGPGCKGNFLMLVKLARIIPVFPDISNQRSMIFIDNLNEFIHACLLYQWSGVLFPQNSFYINTKDIVSEVSCFYGKKIRFISFFNLFIIFLSKYFSLIRKIFGTKMYDFSLSNDLQTYNKVGFRESIQLTLKDIQ